MYGNQIPNLASLGLEAQDQQAPYHPFQPLCIARESQTPHFMSAPAPCVCVSACRHPVPAIRPSPRVLRDIVVVGGP